MCGGRLRKELQAVLRLATSHRKKKSKKVKRAPKETPALPCSWVEKRKGSYEHRQNRVGYDGAKRGKANLGGGPAGQVAGGAKNGKGTPAFSTLRKVAAWP